MRMRLLDYAILCALSGGVVEPALAQSIALPGGGAVRAVEDPVPATPMLSVAVVARPGKPLTFEVATNYADFIAKAEVLVYRHANLIARVPVSIKDPLAQWNGATTKDDLEFVVRVYDAEGRFDESQRAGAASTTPRIRNIVLHGSRVRLLGRDLPKNARITIDGRAVTVDARGEFLAE